MIENIGKTFYSIEDLKTGRERTHIIESHFGDRYNTRIFFKDRLIRQNSLHKKELELFYIVEKEAKKKFPQYFI